VEASSSGQKLIPLHTFGGTASTAKQTVRNRQPGKK
jgi:hypothetical protein